MPRPLKLGLLLLPLLLLLVVCEGAFFPEATFSRKTQGDLFGVLKAVPRPDLRLSSFWHGTFQSAEESYFEANLTFKPDLVRTENTLNLVLFQEISAHTGIPLLLGKQNTLFEMNYVDNLNAVCDEKHDPPPPAPGPIEESAQRLGQAARAFAALGIDFMVVLYPSKAWLLPDRVPARFELPGGKLKAAEGFSHLLAELRKNGVPVIDGVEALTELRQKNPSLPLYNRGGTHWTDPAACSVVQRIVARLPKEGTSRVPGSSGLDCVLGPPAPASGIDTDIAELSNVWDIGRFTDQIPSVTPTLTQRLAGGPRSTLVIGSSFSSHLVRLMNEAHVIRDVNYIEYYRHARSGRINWKRELETRQLVIFEQWQASRMTSNLSEFLDDLEFRSPRFRHAMQAALAH
jgi:hypothetical protein